MRAGRDGASEETMIGGVAMMLRAMAAVALLAAALPANAQQTITKRDIRTQPPARTELQVKDQLWSIFTLDDQRRKEAPHAGLRDIWLQTRAYPTEVPNLCRRDLLILRFAPAGLEGVPDADTPARAYGFDSAHHFRFLRPPDKAYADVEQRPAGGDWHGGCARLGKDDPEFFEADNAFVANDGYRAWRRAVAAVVEGKVKIGQCDRFQVEQRSCDRILADIGQQPINAIARCDAPAATACYKISAAEATEVRVTIASYATGREQDKVLSVDLDFMIVIADALID